MPSILLSDAKTYKTEMEPPHEVHILVFILFILLLCILTCYQDNQIKKYSKVFSKTERMGLFQQNKPTRRRAKAN